MAVNRANILLVEDSFADQIVIQRVFEDGGIDCETKIVCNGQEALDLLLDVSNGDERYRPDLILMDINMPVKDGKQTLEELKNNPHLHSIPVIMLTTSSYDKDKKESLELGAVGYLVKPIDCSDFIQAVQRLDDFLFDLIIKTND